MICSHCVRGYHEGCVRKLYLGGHNAECKCSHILVCFSCLPIAVKNKSKDKAGFLRDFVKGSLILVLSSLGLVGTAVKNRLVPREGSFRHLLGKLQILQNHTLNFALLDSHINLAVSLSEYENCSSSYELAKKEARHKYHDDSASPYIQGLMQQLNEQSEKGVVQNYKLKFISAQTCMTWIERALISGIFKPGEGLPGKLDECAKWYD